MAPELSDEAKRQAQEAVKGVDIRMDGEQPVGPDINDMPDWNDADALDSYRRDMMEMQRQEGRDEAYEPMDAEIDAMYQEYLYSMDEANNLDSMSEEEMEKALSAAHMIKDAVEAESLQATDIDENRITGYDSISPSLTPNPDMTEPANRVPDQDMDRS